MLSMKSALCAFSLFFVAIFCSTSTQGQTPSNCKASQADAVECFVANAVSTGLAKPTHGMTLAQYEQYGVAVNSILQTNHTYIVLLGLSSAVADAMPPTNANGSANSSAQNAAIGSIVTAAVAISLLSDSHSCRRPCSTACPSSRACDTFVRRTIPYGTNVSPGVGDLSSDETAPSRKSARAPFAPNPSSAATSDW